MTPRLFLKILPLTLIKVLFLCVLLNRIQRIYIGCRVLHISKCLLRVEDQSLCQEDQYLKRHHFLSSTLYPRFSSIGMSVQCADTLVRVRRCHVVVLCALAQTAYKLCTLVVKSDM